MWSILGKKKRGSIPSDPFSEVGTNIVKEYSLTLPTFRKDVGEQILKLQARPISELVFILDVDGVLNTGQFLYSKYGKEYKVFGAHDNDGLKLLKGRLHTEFLTADRRGLSITKKRLEDLGYQVRPEATGNIEVHCVNEADRYYFIQKRWGIQNVIYMGDGIHDYLALQEAALSFAPANARREVKKVASIVTPSNAGEGAVLDACLVLAISVFHFYSWKEVVGLEKK